jgi:glutamate synthase (NADPH/NADH) large chain
MVFFPQDARQRKESKAILERNIVKLGLKLLGYRQVPTFNGNIGQASLDVEPFIEQVFIATSEVLDQQVFERKLYVLRNYTSHLVRDTVSGVSDSFYIASLSTRIIVYKGQLTTAQVREYYLDLQCEKTVSALAMFHSRFSTNTFPAWRLAQPFRYLSHNGEINTVKGNINWMKAREALLACPNFTATEMEMLKPIQQISIWLSSCWC